MQARWRGTRWPSNLLASSAGHNSWVAMQCQMAAQAIYQRDTSTSAGTCWPGVMKYVSWWVFVRSQLHLLYSFGVSTQPRSHLRATGKLFLLVHLYIRTLV